jgi:two-component system, OmpR family, response regulator AdeR
MSSHQPTVLISDDEPLVVSALARSFRRAGLSFISDTTSEHVFELARAHQPDVIVLDVNQKIDGRDLLARLKADPETRDLKVLMLSAIDDQFTRVLCLQLGAEDYDIKPFDFGFVNKVARLAGVAVH